jgi:hypothetical protein
MLRAALQIAVLVLIWVAVQPVPATSQTRERDQRTVVVEVRDQGFHWADAGIGALATLGLIAAGAGAMLVLRRSSDGGLRRATASPHPPIMSSPQPGNHQPDGEPPCPRA